MSIQMNYDDASGARSDLRLNQRWVDIPCARLGIDKDRPCATVRHRICRCYERKCRYDYFIARLQTDREQGKVQGGRAIGAGDCMFNATEVCKGRLKFLDILPAR